MTRFYRFALRVMAVVMPLWYHIETEGTELLPEEGGCLYISNHRSMADPILIGMQNPQAQFCFLAKQELFSQGAVGWLLRKLGAVAIDRGSGDLSPLAELENRLKNGDNALIFPEGTRSKDGKLGRFKTGAALIAAQTDVPVVPVVISFTGKLHFRSRIHVRYGAPFRIQNPEGAQPSIATLKQIRLDMHDHVAALLPPPDEQQPAASPRRQEGRTPNMTNRRVDYGKIALVLSIVILGIFAVDFFRRLVNDFRNAKGMLNVISSSSHVESMSDASSADDSSVAVPDSSSSEPDTTPVTPSDYQTVQISSDSIHTGSLILVDSEHPLVGTPDFTPFSAFNYAHLRLPSTALQVNNMTTGAIVNMFNDFFTATGRGNVLVYVTTGEPAVAAYGQNIPERTTGLSLDLGVLDEAVGSHAALSGEGDYNWFSTHAQNYGYVLRYPADKAEQTGKSGLASHYRFVGVPHAAYMYENNLCLEEYLELVQSHTWDGSHLTFTSAGTDYEVYYVPAASGAAATEIPFPVGADPQISGDNIGGFVVVCAKTAA